MRRTDSPQTDGSLRRVGLAVYAGENRFADASVAHNGVIDVVDGLGRRSRSITKEG